MAGNSNVPAAGPATPRPPARQARPVDQDSDDEPDEQTQQRFTTLERVIDQMNEHIQRLQAAIAERDDHVNQLEAQVMAIPPGEAGTAGNRVKLPKPMTFDGTRSKLKTFLVNMEMHIEANQITNDKKKMIFVASCFTDAAAEWIQPMLSELYTIDKGSWGTITRELFSNYGMFKQKLGEAFGNIDELRTAERQLRYLRQTGSAQQLATKFRQIVTPLHYDDAIQIATFENMLKEEVQTELIKLDRPDNIDRFIEMAVKIDNKLFEIKQKRQEFQRWKKVGGFPQYANTSAKRGTQYDKDGDVKMQLNNVISKEEMAKRKENKACYKCGRKGHFARQCRSGQNKQNGNVSPQKITTVHQQVAAIHQTIVTPSDSEEEESENEQVDEVKDFWGPILEKEIYESLKKFEQEDSPGQSKGRLRQSSEREPPQEEDANPEEAQPHLRRGQEKGPIREPRREDQYSKTAGRRIDDLSSGSESRHPLTFRDGGKDREVDHEDSDRESDTPQHSQLTRTTNLRRDAARAIDQANETIRLFQKRPPITKKEWDSVLGTSTTVPGIKIEIPETSKEELKTDSEDSETTEEFPEIDYEEPKRECSCKPPKPVCWEDSIQTYRQHILECEKCHEWTFHKCDMHGKKNIALANEFEYVSLTKGTRLCHPMLGHTERCSCMYYPQYGGHHHKKIHWTQCYESKCPTHLEEKEKNKWKPTAPMIIYQPIPDCPKGWNECWCYAEEIWHPFHNSIETDQCYAKKCPYHEGRVIYTDEDWTEIVLSQKRYLERHRKGHHLIATTIKTGETVIIIKGTINGHEAKLLLDSGASTNYISEAYVKKNRIQTHETNLWHTVQNFEGQITIEGFVRRTGNITLKSGEHEESIQLDLSPFERKDFDIILGMTWLRKHNPVIDWKHETVSIDLKTLQTEQMGIKPNQQLKVKHAEEINEIGRQIETRKKPKEIYEKELKEVLDKLPEKYRDFTELFVKKEYRLPQHEKEYEAEIPLKEGAQVPQVKQRQISQDELRTTKEFIEKFLAAGYIRESKAKASAQAMFVPKRDGSPRMVIDYRKLNNMTEDDANKAPHQEQKRDLLQGAKIMTMFDVEWGYYNLRMKNDDIWKTAFLTDLGLYEWLVAPMGLKRLPAEFARFMTHILREYLNLFVAVYFDDVIVYSKDPKEHDNHVRLVMTKLMEAGLTLKIKKCEFDTTRVNYLGMVYTTNGLEIPKEKLDAILEWPTPTNVHDVQSFLGASGYVRRYLEKYSDVTTPMTELLKKDEPFDWTARRQRSFENVKELVKIAPILQLFNPELQSILRTDASGYALGAIHEQINEKGETQIVAFYSRKFTSAEVNYDVHDRELLAIVQAFRQWRHYLQGAKHEVIVKSDHHNLKYFTTTKELSGRQIRWAEELAKFNYRIEHIPGKQNAAADALSRRPDYAIGIEPPKTNILQEESGVLRHNHNAIIATAIRVVDDDPFYERMYRETNKDQKIQEELQAGQVTKNVQKGLAIWNGMIRVPQNMTTEVIQRYHDPPTKGHQGVERTIEMITRTFYFPYVRKRVENYIRNCDECNRNKAVHHKPFGKMQIPEVPEEAWKSITVDFIQGLPQSKDPVTGITYTDAMITVDRLTKYVILEPTPKDMTAEQCAKLMLRKVFVWTGLPNELITDRDKLFTSKYWQTIAKACGMHHKLSTANHQQTDGQSERMIQTVEQYFRHYLDWEQDNWVELLPLAQFALNNAENATTKQVPHFANLGRHPRMTWSEVPREGLSEAAIIQANKLQALHQTISKDIKWAENRMKTYYDKKREDAPILKKGEKVYLLRRTIGQKKFNIPSKRPSNKLDAIKYGPFTIQEKLANDNYKLRLPARMKVHPVFHISLLEPTENPENKS
ncbi:uncharacterized protein TRUGW13939_04831 [Talaromyces rugulosus]|uniref:RNA-directed DNA polymerase n=1 Tax=Talaromyces rugulosus TaxID=121627 RepID=A0A7H8QY80_TALRU|nr:uncharacterized protein TRUGW13939_04831 [Talaromyces rugulosus]QKX57713.1 hypothetical protein TRUGW13939_04831 [Talaromyces rugulosus]